MKQIKTIALIAHDNKKHDIINWCITNKELLSKYNLCGTGTTASLITDATGLKVKKYLSGPLGGDLQIGGKIAEGKIDLVIFFWDPLTSQPHDPDQQLQGFFFDAAQRKGAGLIFQVTECFSVPGIIEKKSSAGQAKAQCCFRIIHSTAVWTGEACGNKQVSGAG